MWLLAAAVFATWCFGMFGRGYWTPDEPREADLSWRMSWQTERAVPLLAGEVFCEKPPLTYWLAGAAIAVFGTDAWAARLPNLLYALVTTFAVWWLARRAAGPVAALAAAATGATFLLSYQVAIWLATDAPLLAAVAVALAGAHAGFYATDRRERLAGYLVMHAALSVGFLAKSAAAWMVPALALATLIVWERRWRELLRYELWCGLLVQVVVIGAWVWSVGRGSDGAEHLKVFFWNNLVGRFTSVDAPAELQYAAAHQNSPGKYLLEMPIYLWPWTLLVAAALWRAWQSRRLPPDAGHALRFALATVLPSLAVLSLAATARNIYFAPALPGVALLLGWWVRETLRAPRSLDRLALRATAVLIIAAALVAGAAALVLRLGAAWDAWYLALSIAGTAAGVLLAVSAWRQVGRGGLERALPAIVLAYCCVLAGPVAQIYREADRWQDLGTLGAAVHRDAGDSPLLLLAPDETTRAWVDLFVTPTAERVPGPIDDRSLSRMRAMLAQAPRSLVLVQLEGRAMTPQAQALARQFGLKKLAAPVPGLPAWLAATAPRTLNVYQLPNGRRYALIQPSG